MKYTIEFNKKTSEKLYDKVYKTLDLVFGYALTEYSLCDDEKLKSYVLFSDDDAECELDRILEEVEEIFDVGLSYEPEGDEEEEE